MSVDPLTQSYPWYTPYQFAGNKPIWAIDLDGLEEVTVPTLPLLAGEKLYKATLDIIQDVKVWYGEKTKSARYDYDAAQEEAMALDIENKFRSRSMF